MAKLYCTEMLARVALQFTVVEWVNGESSFGEDVERLGGKNWTVPRNPASYHLTSTASPFGA